MHPLMRESASQKKSGRTGKSKDEFVPRRAASALAPITGDRVRRVIRHLSDNKAKGKDSWSIPELRALSKADTDALAQFYNNCETERKWPRNSLRPIVALLDKESAIDEGDLRPIAILPYVYRVWMALRKAHAKVWTRNMHGGAFESAESQAWMLAVKAEPVRHE